MQFGSFECVVGATVSEATKATIVALAVVLEVCGSVLKFFIKPHLSPFHSVLVYKVSLSFRDSLATV